MLNRMMWEIAAIIVAAKDPWQSFTAEEVGKEWAENSYDPESQFSIDNPHKREEIMKVYESFRVE